MKKILVTGGAGYIGSHTVKELLKNNFEVVVIDNLENGFRNAVLPPAKLEVVDLANREKVKIVFEKYQPDAVIDFAAYLAVGESMENPKKYFQNNVANFINLLDVMQEVGCKYLIKSSTAAVYGNPIKKADIPWKESFTEEYQPEKSALLSGKWENKEITGEDFLGKFVGHYQEYFQDREELKLSDDEIKQLRIPLSIYGLSKLLDEIIMKKYDEKHGIKFSALRYFNVCGADPEGEIGENKPDPTTLMSLAILAAAGKIPELKVFGNDYPTPDGTGIRDYIHPTDISGGHIAALLHLVKTGKSEIFNLGTGNGSSVLQVINSVEKAAGRKIETKIYPRRSGDAIISIADPKKAEQKLNWRAKYNLNDMAETAWKWNRKISEKS